MLQHGTLDIRLMVQLAGMIAAGVLSEDLVLLGAALTSGSPRCMPTPISAP
ncbi:MAG TPA: hypothetical protein VIU11_28070 [Nakamurella sp.]